jgi:hypothetical protein
MHYRLESFKLSVAVLNDSIYTYPLSRERGAAELSETLLLLGAAHGASGR